MIVRSAILGMVLLALLDSRAAQTPIRFRDATESAGIHFVHTDGSTGKRYIVETIASGLGLIDYDSDGWIDIYFLNGAFLDGEQPGRKPANALYRNNGDGTFTDVTDASGTGDTGYAMGCAVADFDNDGHEDVYITNFGPNRLLRNRGDGTFIDVTESAGVGDDAFGAGCAFLDFDRDGHVDLYVANYLEFDPGRFQPCTVGAIPVYCDPRTYPPAADRLYRNNGDGTFLDVTESSGIGKHKSYGMGVICSDFDGDGWGDIFVGNDVRGNFLFHNQGDGTFKEIGLFAGVAYDQYGDEQGTMGTAAGDFDGDGLLDLFVTVYQNQPNTLYRNRGNLLFDDVTLSTGAGTKSTALVTWGCGIVDLDNDGTNELFAAAGHLQDTIERYDSSSAYRQGNLLLQRRDGRFADISAESGDGLAVLESSRGAVFGDLDNDGDLDAVVQNSRARPTLLINETRTGNHWALLKLVGTRSNRSAVGAAVRCTAGGRVMVNEVRAGSGYQSADDLRLHFGLGSARRIDRIEVRWPSGRSEVWTDLAADRIIQLEEGKGSSVPR